MKYLPRLFLIGFPWLPWKGNCLFVPFCLLSVCVLHHMCLVLVPDKSVLTVSEGSGSGWLPGRTCVMNRGCILRGCTCPLVPLPSKNFSQLTLIFPLESRHSLLYKMEGLGKVASIKAKLMRAFVSIQSTHLLIYAQNHACQLARPLCDWTSPLSSLLVGTERIHVRGASG